MTDTAPEEAEMLKWAKGYAQKHGWILNKDEKQLGTVIKGLVRNKNKFGHPTAPAGSGAGTRRRTGPSNVPVCTIRTR